MAGRRIVIAALAGLLLGVWAGFSAVRAQGKDVIVFATASLKSALDEIVADWARTTGAPLPKIAYAASNTLALQIEQGAPADLFLSADLDWMDYVASRGLIRPETRTNLLANRIVLIAPKDAKTELVLSAGAALGPALGGGKLAMGNVSAVPAGKYGKAALEKLGQWEAVKGQVVQADNVRVALLLVARGEAPLGIVYRTDAASDPGVRVVATFPEETHPPVVYPGALMRASTNPAAAALLDALRGAAAAQIFSRHGFIVLARPRPAS